MITLGIVEDEAKMRRLLRALIDAEFTNFSVCGEAESVEAGLEMVAEQRPQALLLDVELGDGSGFDLLARLQDYRPQVIFITAYDHYAVQALRSEAVDYLEKPVDPPALAQALNRLRQRLANSQPPVYPTAPQPGLSRIAVPTRHGTVFIEAANIRYVKADGSYAELHFAPGERPLVVSRVLREIQEVLEPLGFVRVHRSYLVNARLVVSIQRSDGGYVVLPGDRSIAFSSQHKEAALQRLASFSTAL